MKKLNLFALAFAVLASQTGCIGSKPDEAAIPYATTEIQEKLAKRISPELQTVPKDYFETLNYGPFYEREDDILSVLNTPEEKQFWKTLAALRMQMAAAAALAAEDTDLLDEQLQDTAISPAVLSAVLDYEKAHPYTPDLTEVDQARKFMIGMALGNMPIPPGEEETKKYIEQWGGEDTAKFFQKVRTELLAHFEAALQQRKAGQTPDSFEDRHRREQGIAEYTVHFVGPVLYPAEMMFAEFALSPTDEKAVYSYPALFFENQAPSSLNSSRLENEKPLPYKLDLMWYSITENKVYALETELPRETLKAKILGGAGKWDALLFTLEPYGKVTLYAFNQTNNKKEKLASFEAKTADTPFERFQQVFGQYDNRETPAKNWDEYRQYALANFPEAAENLKKNGRPVDGPDVNYWEENPENIFEGLPDAQDINTPDKDSFTPLMNAIRKNAGNTVSTLIKEGADVNYQAPSGETALGLAVDGNFVSFTKELIAAGADVNKRNTASGRTPLIDAAMTGNAEIVKMLLEAGADKNARVFLYGQELDENALTAAVNNGNSEIADILRHAGAEEITPGAPSAEAEQAAQNVYNSMGITPLHYALLAGETEKVKELIASGADVNAKAPNMGTPLLYACTVGNAEAARLLINAKADVNAAGDTGYTPLMMACQMGNKELAEILLAAGADVNAKHVMNGQATGLTPLKIAQDGGHTEIAAMLAAAGAH